MVCVSGAVHGWSEVSVDAVGVDERELFQDAFPVRGDLALDSRPSALRLSDGRPRSFAR